MKIKKTLNERRNIEIKLNQIQQEHAVVKETYDNYVNEKNELMLVEMKVKKNNQKILCYFQKI